MTETVRTSDNDDTISRRNVSDETEVIPLGAVQRKEDRNPVKKRMTGEGRRTQSQKKTT